MKFKGITHIFDPSSIRLVLGIGNPEEDYSHTYHNAGLLFASTLSERLGEARESKVANKRTMPSVFLASYPEPFTVGLTRVSMNLSGRAAKEALSSVQASPSVLLLAHDDSDLPLGSFRFSFGRGSAGHHGVDSVMGALGTKNFWRLRLGIRHEERHGNARARSIVLRNMPAPDRRALQKTFGEIIPLLLQN